MASIRKAVSLRVLTEGLRHPLGDLLQREGCMEEPLNKSSA